MTWSGIADSAPSERDKPKTVWGLKRSTAWVGLAAAASLLLAVVTLLRFDVRGRSGAVTEAEAYAQSTDLLQHGEFEQARMVIVEAAGRGIQSDRLRTVEAQTLRRIPGTIALAYAGRLTDFGFEIGGATARSTAPDPSDGRAEEVLKVLALTSPDDDAAGLNRGHAMLSLQRPREALAEFQRVAQRSARSALARLGAGLAFFALSDYPAAENAFRACLQLDPKQDAARINLAMTLAEEGKIDEALPAWEDVLARPNTLSEAERRAIQREVEELRAARQRSPSSPSGNPGKEPR